MSREAQRVVREARGGPARHLQSDCPHTGPPRARPGFLHPRCCRSQCPGPVYRSLASWFLAAGLGDSCVFLSALLRWRFDTALLCLNDQQLEIYVQSPCWVNTRLALCPRSSSPSFHPSSLCLLASHPSPVYLSPWFSGWVRCSEASQGALVVKNLPIHML